MKSIHSLSRLFVFGCLLATAVTATAQDRISWLTDLREARELAERQNRLVLLHFWSETCGPCKRLERYVFNQPEFIRALTSGYIPVKINVESQPRLVQFYNVSSWPTDVIVTPEGREIQRFISKQDANDYIAMLDGVRARASVNGYVPVANNAGEVNAPTAGYLNASTTTPNPGYGPLSPPNNAGAALPQQENQSGNPYANAPVGNAAPQQQALAPRYANPYGQAGGETAADRGSRWTPNQGSQSRPPVNSQPTENPYAFQQSNT